MGCLIALSIFNTFQNADIVLQSIEGILQCMVEYLTDLQSYIGEKRMGSMLSNLVENETEVACPSHHYRSRIIQRHPLIIYIENFLTRKEIDHLIELA